MARAVYSSDGKELGEVASVQQGDLDADWRATPTLIKADQIQDDKDHGIVLRLAEAEAKTCQRPKRLHLSSENTATVMKKCPDDYWGLSFPRCRVLRR